MDSTRQKLYPEVLGESSKNLDAPLRAFHGASGPVEGEGRFSITRGPGWFGRLLAALLRMPPSGENIPTLLKVLPEEDKERWLRAFGGHALRSLQWERGGLLIERAGLLELGLRLTCDEGDLLFSSPRAWLWLGLLRLPLPRWLSPRIRARESAALDGSIKTDVRIELPWGSGVLRYQGEFQWREAR